MISAFLGVALKIVPEGNFARFLLMMFLLYSMVIRACYQGSYYKILRSHLRKAEMQSLDEIIENELTFYVNLGSLDAMAETDAMRNR